MLRLAARHADVWNGYWISSAAEASEHLRALRNACTAEARSPDTMRTSVSVHLVFTDLLADEEVPSGALRGTADELAERLAEYEQVGLDLLIVRQIPQQPETLEAFHRITERYRA